MSAERPFPAASFWCALALSSPEDTAYVAWVTYRDFLVGLAECHQQCPTGREGSDFFHEKHSLCQCYSCSARFSSFHFTSWDVQKTLIVALGVLCWVPVWVGISVSLLILLFPLGKTVPILKFQFLFAWVNPAALLGTVLHNSFLVAIYDHQKQYLSCSQTKSESMERS